MEVDVFYSTTCNECKCLFSKDVPPRRCLGCRLVSYCSTEHQKKNWRKHKELCKRVQEVLKDTGKESVFEGVDGSKDWWGVRTGAMHLVEKAGTKPLLPHQRQVFLFPDACRICYKTYPTRLEPCRECQCVSYCSEVHRLLDLQAHQFVCPALKLCMDVDVHMVHSSFELNELPCVSLEIQQERPDLPDDMDQFIYSYFSSDDNEVTSVLTSEILTCVATIMYGIEKSKQHISSERLTIHVLGPRQLEYSLFETLEILFHWFSRLKHLEIVLVGPECPSYPEDVSQCKECLASRTILIDVHSTYYHDFLSGPDPSTPDIIVAFNCGLHEFQGDISDTWAKSIPCFLQFPNVFIILTSYNTSEAAKDVQRILDCAPLSNVPRLLAYCEENPFRSLRPYRDWEHHTDSVFHQNNIISILKTLPQ